eukprot:1406820-Prymnesium_polylepis.3
MPRTGLARVLHPMYRHIRRPVPGTISSPDVDDPTQGQAHRLLTSSRRVKRGRATSSTACPPPPTSPPASPASPPSAASACASTRRAPPPHDPWGDSAQNAGQHTTRHTDTNEVWAEAMRYCFGA